jgi:hypothetical protein
MMSSFIRGYKPRIIRPHREPDLRAGRTGAH